MARETKNMTETVVLQIPEALYQRLAIAILYNSLILERSIRSLFKCQNYLEESPSTPDNAAVVPAFAA
jgi:hypothetical protein